MHDGGDFKEEEMVFDGDYWPENSLVEMNERMSSQASDDQQSRSAEEGSSGVKSSEERTACGGDNSNRGGVSFASNGSTSRASGNVDSEMSTVEELGNEDGLIPGVVAEDESETEVCRLDEAQY